MAETPLCAYAVVDSAPGLVLTVLYRHAQATEVKAYLGGAKRPPLARCSVSEVQEALPRMSRTRLFANLATLRSRGLIEDDEDGFLLLARESRKRDSARAREATAAHDLVEELAHAHQPSAPHRRFFTTSRRHVDLAHQLLTRHPTRHPASLILAYAHDFAEVIRADQAHEFRWRPAMLRPEVWLTICATVDTWRRERLEEQQAEAAAQARRREKGLMAEAYPLIRQALGSMRNMLGNAEYEADDALQEIVLIFTQRLRGENPYDPARHGGNNPLRSYVYMLTHSVMLNRIARADRRRRNLGVLAQHHRDRFAELDIEALLAANPPPSAEGAILMGTPTAGRKTAFGAKTISKAAG